MALGFVFTSVWKLEFLYLTLLPSPSHQDSSITNNCWSAFITGLLHYYVRIVVLISSVQQIETVSFHVTFRALDFKQMKDYCRRTIRKRYYNYYKVGFILYYSCSSQNYEA